MTNEISKQMVVKGIEELSPCITAVDEAITAVGDGLEPLFNCAIADIAANVSSLQRAKLDLISLYAANSLFWVYLKSRGINPATHGLSKELDRVKTYLKRMKELEDKKLIPTIDGMAMRRLMRNALWSAAHKTKEENDDTLTQPPSATSSEMQAPATSSQEPSTPKSQKTEHKKKKKSKRTIDGDKKSAGGKKPKQS